MLKLLREHFTESNAELRIVSNRWCRDWLLTPESQQLFCSSVFNIFYCCKRWPRGHEIFSDKYFFSASEQEILQGEHMRVKKRENRGKIKDPAVILELGLCPASKISVLPVTLKHMNCSPGWGWGNSESWPSTPHISPFNPANELWSCPICIASDSKEASRLCLTALSPTDQWEYKMISEY